MALGMLLVGAVAGWSLARTQNPATPAEPAPPAVVTEGPLETLDWLVGDWVDDHEEVSIEFSCHFTKNGAFLLRSFGLHNPKHAGLSGMQLMAWDGARKTIRSWTFDSKGGFGEEFWSQAGNRYTIRCTYTLPDGGTGSNIQIINFIDANKFTWKSVDRVIDGEMMPDTDEITLVRKPTTDDAKGGK
ncbi:MAG: hypothetical protein K1X57_00505 [Gemmataceae bacterium]|nr:hypothetical protein [Gemmataceae bacterium]